MSPCHGHNQQPAGWLQCSDAGCPSCCTCGYNVGPFSGSEDGNEGGKEADSDEGSRCSCCKRFPQPARVTTTIITIIITAYYQTMNTTNIITTINISPASSSHQASSDGEHKICPPLTILLVGGGRLTAKCISYYHMRWWILRANESKWGGFGMRATHHFYLPFL